ncbi:MAG TPA: hypothetical protein DIW46_01905 [Microbacterium sp.]|nr:hypothetical protein [Microbacterium sp.]
MSKTLDVLEQAVHGSAAGFKIGCKSRGGCPNYGSREHLTCSRAYRAWVHYRRLYELSPETPITWTMLRHAKGRH